MITTAQVAKLLVDNIGKQVGNDLMDNLGDGASICFVGILPTIDIFELAEHVLAGVREDAPYDPDMEEAYKEWKKHG